MSSSFVRKTFKQVAATVTSGDPDYPAMYYDTVNKSVTPADDFWFAANFFMESTECNTYDDHYTESGLIDLTFFCAGGRGDSIIEVCETISRNIYKTINSNSSTTGFVIKKVMAPEELQTKASLGFEVAVGLEYEYIYKIL